MSDVSINIRGRDENVGNLLDNLRDKAKGLGVDLSNLQSDWDNANGRQNKKDVLVDNLSQVREAEIDKIRREYNDLRELNRKDFDDAVSQRAGGNISASEFDKRRKEYHDANSDLDKQEAEEIKQVDRDSNLQLRLIYRLLRENDQRRRERNQNDSDEFRGSSSSAIQNRINQLEQERDNSTDEDEKQRLQERIDEGRRQLEASRRKEDSEGDGGKNHIRGISSAAQAAASGDLMGTSSGLMGLMGSNPYALIGTAIIGGIVGFMMNGDKVRENLERAAAARGFGSTAGGANIAMSEQLTSQYDLIGSLGKSPDEIASMMGSKLESSKIGGESLARRTIDDFAFQKGFGADAGIFSQFERFNEGQRESVDIALDVLNTLDSIQRSQLKEGDLSTLSEKLQSQNVIMGIQRQKTDLTNSTEALRLLSGFESVGLSGKGERGGDFLQRTINGLGAGGDQNLMMLKYQFMSEVHPELMNDPAEMAMAMRFNNSDPEYIKHSLSRIKEMSGGNKMNWLSMIDGLFGADASKLDLDMWWNADKMDINPIIGSRKKTLSKQQSIEDAQSSVGQLTEWMNQFQGVMQDLFTSARKLVGDYSDGDSIKVKVTNPPSSVKSTNYNANGPRPGK